MILCFYRYWPYYDNIIDYDPWALGAGDLKLMFLRYFDAILKSNAVFLCEIIFQILLIHFKTLR